ncbi:hypothetical protein BDP27DRAFT_1418945 [Rhodocollybia butyracea]|uniref:Heterokaryon incompatibility domain-containing protein n=1 Tax=Rhodocollybia butyracea TaxID=206335 RepID=A0A9P5U927_9AGAR|nr:hypothetical protein BDP27DRAFT_1418945 [Rhodocollybia butyracea]
MQDPSGIKDMKGYSKIVRAGEQARSDKCKYIWVDTCCIDKTSSSELSEAINSMYRYYREATVCYAYLADRGWTLQELLAPRIVVFFASDWKAIGAKASLHTAITEITGIPSNVLLMSDPGEISVAQRMSWAAGRETTRVEDRTYSLMGLFGVFMPTIYGEGTHAFTRLQEEILKVSDDQTIFAWKSEPEARSVDFSGILATSPDDFAESGEFEQFNWTNNRQPYSMTNLGLQIRLPLIPIIHPGVDRAIHRGAVRAIQPRLAVRRRHYRDGAPLPPPEFLALLNARRQGTSEHLAIYVKSQMSSIILDQCGKIEGSPQELFFKERVPSGFESINQDSPYRISFLIPPAEITIKNCYPPKCADAIIFQTFFLDPQSSAALLFRVDQSDQVFVVMVGIHNSNIWLDVVIDLEQNKAVDLKGIHDSYYDDNGQHRILEKNLDKTSKFLADNQVISVEARYRLGRPDDYAYMVDIRILDGTHPDAARPVILSIAFQYISLVRCNAGNDLLEAYPSTLWESLPHKQDTMDLFLDRDGISGVLHFRHRKSGERFVVVLGIHDNGEMWSDTLTKKDCDFDKESVADIHDSY